MVKSLPKQKPQNRTEKTQPNFKGVRVRKWGKWVSEVRMPNSRARIWLGSYDFPHQAARAYDCAVYCLRGCNANFNFPNFPNNLLKPQNNLQKEAGELKGVRKRKWGKWVFEVRMPKSRPKIWLGSYDSPQQATRAYDCAVYCLRGSNAKLNFPDSLSKIPSASSLSPAQIQAVAAKFAREEFQQSVDENSAISTSDSECSTGSVQKLEEEEEWMLLFDSLLQDMHRNPSLHLIQDLPMIEHFEEEFPGVFLFSR